MDIHRYSTAVVCDGDGLVLVNFHGDIRAVTRQGFVDGVVDDLEDHVVKTGPVIGVANVHSGAFSDGVEAFQDLDFTGVVNVGAAHGIPGIK